MSTSIHIETPPKVTVEITAPGNYTIDVETPQAAVIEVAGLVPGNVGASAYQVAISNGFIGTEQEWLESLQAGNYTHIQDIPATIWTGANPLQRALTAVHVIDTGGNQWECTFESTRFYYSINVGLAPFAGTATLI